MQDFEQRQPSSTTSVPAIRVSQPSRPTIWKKVGTAIVCLGIAVSGLDLIVSAALWPLRIKDLPYAGQWSLDCSAGGRRLSFGPGAATAGRADEDDKLTFPRIFAARRERKRHIVAQTRLTAAEVWFTETTPGTLRFDGMFEPLGKDRWSPVAAAATRSYSPVLADLLSQGVLLHKCAAG